MSLLSAARVFLMLTGPIISFPEQPVLIIRANTLYPGNVLKQLDRTLENIEFSFKGRRGKPCGHDVYDRLLA